MAGIDRQRVIGEFMELVQFPSTSGNERMLADCLIDRLRKLNFEVTEDDAGTKLGWDTGNVIAKWPATVSGKKSILFCAHMDHVAPGEKIVPYVKDGAIYSQGSTVLGADDKAGIVAIMEALRVIYEERQPHGDIEILFTVGEENGLNGAKNLNRALLTAEVAYVLDTNGSAGKIVIQAPAQNKIKAIIHGKSAHAGIAPEAGINAIQAAGAAVAQMKSGRIDYETTANVGVFQGGTATNIVPERVEVLCEARSLQEDKLESQTWHMQETFMQVAAQWGARAEVTVEKQYQSFKLEESSDVVQLAMRAARRMGASPILETTGGGSDANFLNLYGIPSVVLGAGMQNVHTTDEFIYIDDLVRSAEYVLSIIQTTVEG